MPRHYRSYYTFGGTSLNRTTDDKSVFVPHGISLFLFRWGTAELCGVRNQIPAWERHLELKASNSTRSVDLKFSCVNKRRKFVSAVHSDLNTVTSTYTLGMFYLCLQKLWRMQLGMAEVNINFCLQRIEDCSQCGFYLHIRVSSAKLRVNIELLICVTTVVN